MRWDDDGKWVNICSIWSIVRVIVLRELRHKMLDFWKMRGMWSCPWWWCTRKSGSELWSTLPQLGSWDQYGTLRETQSMEFFQYRLALSWIRLPVEGTQSRCRRPNKESRKISHWENEVPPLLHSLKSSLLCISLLSPEPPVSPCRKESSHQSMKMM